MEPSSKTYGRSLLPTLPLEYSLQRFLKNKWNDFLWFSFRMMPIDQIQAKRNVYSIIVICSYWSNLDSDWYWWRNGLSKHLHRFNNEFTFCKFITCNISSPYSKQGATIVFINLSNVSIKSSYTIGLSFFFQDIYSIVQSSLWGKQTNPFLI